MCKAKRTTAGKTTFHELDVMIASGRPLQVPQGRV